MASRLSELVLRLDAGCKQYGANEAKMGNPQGQLDRFVREARQKNGTNDILGPEIILARGCENVAGKLRQKW